MAWTNLPTDYTNVKWSGLKKYNEINNSDGTVSFQDVTKYSESEKSYFSATDANQMNGAINTIMGNSAKIALCEVKGTDLNITLGEWT